METNLLNVAEQASNQPGVAGYICVDNEGLCLAAKGQASQAMSGVIHQIAKLASKIEKPDEKALSGSGPVIRVDLERYKMLIQSQDSITTCLMLPHD